MTKVRIAKGLTAMSAFFHLLPRKKSSLLKLRYKGALR